MLQNAQFCIYNFKIFSGVTPPNPLCREGATPSRTHPHGRPTALRAFGRPAAAARPIAGTQEIRAPPGFGNFPPGCRGARLNTAYTT